MHSSFVKRIDQLIVLIDQTLGNVEPFAKFPDCLSRKRYYNEYKLFAGIDSSNVLFSLFTNTSIKILKKSPIAHEIKTDGITLDLTYSDSYVCFFLSAYSN